VSTEATVVPSNFEQDLTAEQKIQLDKFQPMWKIVLTQFIEHKAAVIGLIVISWFVIVSLSAPLLARVTGLDPERQNPMKRYLPVNTMADESQDVRDELLTNYLVGHQADSEKIFSLLKEKNLTSSLTAEEALHEVISKPSEEALEFVTPLAIPEIDGFKQVLGKVSVKHWLGTDELGRDVMIRLVFGTRVSMSVGILVAISSSFIGLLIGSFAGYYGGAIDTALMRVTDSLLSLPILPIQIVIAAIDMNKIPFLGQWIGSANQSMYKLTFILVLFSWMTVALLVRGSILSLREREFILASKTLGAKDSTIIFRHMFPNVVAPLLVSVTLGVGESILWEAALSFLGLGIQQPTPSWGNMLFNAQDLMTEAPFLAVLPGLLILATTISFNYLGDGLQDAIDPKAIRR
jgi:peptide/nickel transport system permease protein